MKLKNRANRGITLVALVITIIILLILTGITISTLTNSGLFVKARQAQDVYRNAQNNENTILKEYEEWIANSGNLPENTADTKAGTLVKTPDKWYIQTPDIVETSDGTIVEKGKKTSNVYAISDGQANTIPVPYGFYYVGGTSSTGVVISDDSRDKDKYAGQIDVGDGVVYNLETGIPKAENELTEEEKKKVIFGNQFVWIPITEGEYKKTNWGSTYKDATWETKTHSSEFGQIRKYEGFYVGRYEAGTSNITLTTNVDFSSKNPATNWHNNNFSIRDGLNNTASGKITSKAGEIPYYFTDYFTALELSNNMYKTECVQSGLMTGTMWDVMMNFIAGEEKTIVTTNKDWGNYQGGNNNINIKYTEGKGRYATINSDNGTMTSAFTKSDAGYHFGIRTTASTEDVKKKNLYDVAGNLWEWTQESAYVNTSECYMLRSGSLTNNSPACYRHYYAADLTGTSVGFRPVLYIQ